MLSSHEALNFGVSTSAADEAIGRNG